MRVHNTPPPDKTVHYQIYSLVGSTTNEETVRLVVGLINALNGPTACLVIPDDDIDCAMWADELNEFLDDRWESETQKLPLQEELP